MVARVAGDFRVPEHFKDAVKDASYMETYGEPVLYLMPYTIEIE